MGGHTYCRCLFHCVFSTKDRQPIIPAEIQERLWSYLGGIARRNGMSALAVGGAADHVHMLLALPATLSLAEAMRRIKAGSSLWMHDVCDKTGFAWQEGYGAFSLGQSQVQATFAHIRGQRERHQKRDFQGGVFGDFEAVWR